MFLSNKKNMLYKASKHAEEVAKMFTYTLSTTILLGTVFNLYNEMLRFRHEQTGEIVHPSCLNVNGSISMYCV